MLAVAPAVAEADGSAEPAGVSRMDADEEESDSEIDLDDEIEEIIADPGAGSKPSAGTAAAPKVRKAGAGYCVLFFCCFCIVQAGLCATTSPWRQIVLLVRTALPYALHATLILAMTRSTSEMAH